MPSEDQIIINFATPSSIADRGNIDDKTNRRTNLQKQNAFQKFEFVSSEDAHRARSYAMRQSWRKRKQQQKVEKKENDIPERRTRPLVAKPEQHSAKEVSVSSDNVAWNLEDAAADGRFDTNSTAPDDDSKISSEGFPKLAAVDGPLDAEYDSLNFSNTQLLKTSIHQQD